jgi:hypothetical protein
VNIDATLDHGDDEELWDGDQQDDHPKAGFSVEHIAQYAEQRTRLHYRSGNAISDEFPDRLRLTGDRGD